MADGASGRTPVEPVDPIEFSDVQRDFRAVVREFARTRVAPFADEWDAHGEFPLAAVQEMGDLGLFGITAEEQYGGTDAGLVSLCLAIEEIGRADQSLGITLEAAVGLGIQPIATYGSAEQKQRWLPDLVAGRALAGFGLTEPGAGSDAAAITTRARLDADEWVLDGAKQFITNSGTPITSLVTVMAVTDQHADGRTATSAIVVPAGTAGFTVEPAYRKLGWHSSDTHALTFAGARVPAGNLLGRRGRGLAQFLATLAEGRIAVAALAVGCIQACLDLAVPYAGERVAFGAPIGRKQGVAFDLADVAVMADAARALTYRAAAAYDAGASPAQVSHAASVAKLYATESAVTATRVATQVFGGYGFCEEYPIARFYRDAKILEIGEGTSQVQRLLIARGLGLDVE